MSYKRGDVISRVVRVAKVYLAYKEEHWTSDFTTTPTPMWRTTRARK